MTKFLETLSRIREDLAVIHAAAKRIKEDLALLSAEPQPGSVVPLPDEDTWKEQFDAARKRYPGRKRGLDPEYKTFIKVCKAEKLNPGRVIPELLPAIDKEDQYRKHLAREGEFVPSWKHFQTWLNQLCWTQEYAEEELGDDTAEIDEDDPRLQGLKGGGSE